MPKKKESIYDRVESVQDTLNDASDEARKYVEDHPLSSLLIAFGIGTLAGAVLMKILERK
jgi:ElaB/YqjD/DUF883 family membrane-anchored ribosome-binding protein